MAIQYGLLKGKVVGSVRAEVVEQRVNSNHLGNGHYISNHFHLLVEAGGGTWRCPVNVRSQDGSEIWLTVQDTFRDQPILERLPEVAEGLLQLPQRRPGVTLDFIREPLFDRTTMRHLPILVAGVNNDAQDHLELYANQAQADPGTLVYVFGSFWRNEQFPPDKLLNTHQGVHDVHMNQGNDPGHLGDDGVYQDGGVIFHYTQPDRYVGVFLAFQSQVWFTDNQKGHRLPGHAEGPLAEVGGPQQPPTQPGGPALGIASIRIIAALTDPAGDDVGQETISLFNATLAPVNLSGWKLMDRQNKVESLTGVQIDANDSVTIRLTGKGVQLSNKGGAIRLIDPNDQLVDVVTYTQAQAVSGRILVF